MSFFKKISLILLIVFGFLIPTTLVLAASGDTYGLDTAAKTAELDTVFPAEKTLPGLAGDIVGVGLSLVGIIFFGLMLYAGIRWMAAMGKTEDVQKAKDTLEAAAIGLVIVLAAYAITRFVFGGLGIGTGGGEGEGGGGGGEKVCLYNCAQGSPCQEFENTDAAFLEQKATEGDCGSQSFNSCSEVAECTGGGVVKSCNDCCYDECQGEGNADECARECQACKGGNKKYEAPFATCTGSCSALRASAGTPQDCAGAATMIFCDILFNT